MAILSKSSLLTAAFFFSFPALAYTWEWEGESLKREWQEDSLDWASDAHPDSPSPLILLTTTSPPPREMWCTETGKPTVSDCDTFDALLEGWVRDYLSLPESANVPADVLDAFPSECISICN